MQQGSKKALKMLQLWQQSVDKDDFTYSVLAAALEKRGFRNCAHNYCYTSSTGNHITIHFCACSEGRVFYIYK